MRTLVYESIPVAVLPSGEHESAARRVCSAFDTFLECEHYSASNIGSFNLFCADCSRKLEIEVGKDADYLPSVERFVETLLEAKCDTRRWQQSSVLLLNAGKLKAREGKIANFVPAGAARIPHLLEGDCRHHRIRHLKVLCRQF